MTFDLADLTALDLLDAELVGCVGADFGDNMVAAFEASKAPAPPAAEGGPLTAAYDAARSFFYPKAETPATPAAPPVVPAAARPAPPLVVTPAPAALVMQAPASPPAAPLVAAQQASAGAKRNQQIALGLGALALVAIGTALITR